MLPAAEPAPTERVLHWEKLPAIPDRVGFASPFAGTHNGALLVAGGANFPDKLPWEGGTKTWYDSIFVLENPQAQWKTAGQLPRPLGYGVSLSTKDGVLCLGGSDAQRHYADAFLLQWNNSQVSTQPLPPLPKPCANFCGAILGNTVYVAGGIETPTATVALKTFWSLSLTNIQAGWRELEPWPGPARMLATAGAQEGSFFLISGAGLKAGPDGKPVREWLRDAYRFTPGKGWKRIADLPRVSVAAPTPALAIGPAHLLVLGGDDGAQINAAPTEHKGFPRDVLAYHTITDTWARMGEVPFSLVTTPAVEWNNRFIVPGGEARPGIRSTEVWAGEPVMKKSGFVFLDYVVLGVYLLSMVIIGWYCSKRESTTDDFFLAGKRIPWWAAGLSILGTQLSAITFMAAPAKSYATDLIYMLGGISIVLVAPIVIRYFLPFFRQLNITTAYEYLEKRFNLPVRLLASFQFCVFQIGRMGVVLFLPSIALSAVTGMDVATCILLMGVLTTIYTVMGGIEAVIWTDVVQVVVLMGGALLCLGMVLFGVEGGPAEVWRIAAADHKLRWVDWTFDPTTTAVWVMIFGQVFHNFMPYGADQAVIQRYLTTPDEKQAARAIWVNAWATIPVTIIFNVMGIALYAFYKTHPDLLEPSLKTDAILPWFIAREVPPGLTGLFIAAIFAAAMSTLDSSMNSVATAVTTDFLKRFRPQTPDRACLNFARWLTVLLGAFATITAILMAKFGNSSLLDLFLNILGLFGGTLSGLFILGIFVPRANGVGALIGSVASGFVVYFVSRHTPLHFFLYAAVGVVSCVTLGTLASLVFPRASRPTAGLTWFSFR
ncbi:MAG: sodium/solute symporter [Verrucomicrobiota bacterium]